MEPPGRHPALLRRILPAARLARHRPDHGHPAAPGTGGPQPCVSRDDFDRLSSRRDISVRDRCLWRFLYESAALPDLGGHLGR